MAELLTNAFIIYCLGLFLVPSLRAGTRLRRILELPYAPMVRLGLWHRWSMYAPEVPTATSLALVGVTFDDGSFEVISLPGFDDDTGFGKAGGLRFIAFQLALCSKITDYMKPSLCRYALRRWRDRASPLAKSRVPVGIEIREYVYPSPPPGTRQDGQIPEVRTLWTESIEAETA